MALIPSWRHMADSDGSRISIFSVNYDRWLEGIDIMSRSNFQLTPGIVYLVPTYAAREIIFDQDEDGTTPFEVEFAGIRADAEEGWNRPGAIADSKRGLVRWESPLGKGVLQARRSGKKGPWTIELESPPILGTRFKYKSPDTIPNQDFPEIVNRLFGWFNEAKSAVYSEWLKEPFVIATDIVEPDGKSGVGVSVFGARPIADMWQRVGKTNLGWFKVTTEDGMSPSNQEYSELNMALLTMAFHESWVHNKIIVEGQAMSKNNGEHQWWMIEGNEKGIKGFIKSAKRSSLHWVIDDQLRPGSNLLRVYLNIQPVEKRFVESITSKLGITPTMIENVIRFEPAPCGTNTTDLTVHSGYCKSCKTLAKNKAQTDAKAAAKVVGSTDPKSGPVVTIQEPPKPVKADDLESLANQYYAMAEFHQAEANKFLQLAEKCELVLKPSDELQELRAKLEAAEKAAEDQRKKDLAEIEAARTALV